MSRGYDPLGQSFNTPLEDQGEFDDNGYAPGGIGSPEVHNDPQRPDYIPLITQNSRQAVSPDNYDGGGYRSRRDVSPNPPRLPGHSPGQSYSSAFNPAPVRRKPVESHSTTSLRKSFLNPNLHKHALDPNRPYARYYNFRRSRDKLFTRTFRQWIVTALFAAAIAGTLAGFEKLTTINQNQKHVFNAIVTGLSLCLGMSLASSLKEYALLLRWRLLTTAWVTLKEFDLILQCHSLLKVCELLWETPRRRRPPFLSMIHLLCLIYLFCCLSAQVLVAMVGLVYSLDTAALPITVPGPVKIVDLSFVRDVWAAGSSSVAGQAFSAHAYGIQGQDYAVESVDNPFAASYGKFQTLFTDVNYSYWLYRFIDTNPTGQGSNAAAATSNRTVTAKAQCNAYDVTAYQNETVPGDPELWVWIYNDGEQDRYLYVREYAYGATTWIAEYNQVCGDRCTQVWGFQAKQAQYYTNQPISIDRYTIYECTNTISTVSNSTGEAAPYALGDPQARWVAGAIGWNGFIFQLPNGTYDHREYMLYSNDSYWSPNYVMAANNENSAAMIVSQFSIAALAAMDENGVHVIVENGFQPQRALTVTVEWHWCIPLLGSIVAVQLLALIVVVLWANKAAIIDDSCLAISKLLAPTVQKLGAHGSVLTGEEIAFEVDRMMGGNYKISYGCRDIDEKVGSGSSTGSLYGGGIRETIRHVDIIEQAPGASVIRRGRIFGDGMYD